MISTPKNQRLQMLAGVGTAPGSPLKRRSALNISIVSLPPPTINPELEAENVRNQTLNDDEAERRTSRRFENSVTEQESVTNLNEAADSLNNCLKLFAENKINKDNAWSLNIIDSFAKLIQKHHHVLSNFQVAGTTLEASAKVYGLRVDSVYTDVCRMSADLARQTAKALTKRGNRQLDNEDDSDRDQNEGEDKENLNATNQSKDQQPKTKKAKKRKNISTVTKNPESLNARLDTIPLTDPFFAKLNSVIGDTTSSKRLMQNIIPTEDSKLKLRQNMPIWNLKDQRLIDLEEKLNYKNQDPLSKVFSLKPNVGNIARFVLRTGLSTYKLSNEPMERYEDNDNSFRSRFGDDMNDTVIHNASNVALQFDINAAVEPVPLENSVVMDFGDMDQGDFDDLTEMDRVAVDRCKGLRRQPIVIEDMQPEGSDSLEYSYRKLDMIGQFWAGPSHWKFRQSRRTFLSIGQRSSQFESATELSRTSGLRGKVVRKRKIIKKMEGTLEDSTNVDDDLGGLIMKITQRTRGTQLSNQTISKKWDSKKHKLPIDYKVPLDIFDKFENTSTVHINSNHDVTFTGNDEDAAPYDYNNETDRDYCSRVADMQSDTETETNTDMGQMDNNMEFDNNEMPPPLAPIDEIPDIFEGAPERIEKISIAFAKRAKVVDMKQLKACSWTLIKNKHNLDPTQNPKFSDTLKELPRVLSRTMAENMSMPLAFYAILHLCNDKNLLLIQNDDRLRDFDIQFLQTNVDTTIH